MNIAEKLSDNPRYLLAFAACISLAVSAIDNYFSPVLSGDSLLYIHTARVFIDQGFQAAVGSYYWPFLSILVSFAHQTTGLTLVTSGYIIIAVLYALLTCTFVSIVRDFGGSSKTQLLALLIIIIFPTINDYRSYITRDAGYWLFSLISLQQLMRFAIHKHYRHALGWLLAIGIAILFRTEGLFIAALSPMAILADGQFNIRERLNKAGHLYTIILAAVGLALVLIFTTPALNEKLRVVSELLNITTFFQELVSSMVSVLDHYASAAQNKYIAADINVIIITGLIGLTLYTPLHALTLPYLVLLVWPHNKRPYPFSRYQVYLIAYVLIVLVYLFLMSLKKQFLADRFCVLIALVIMLVLPFYIERIWNYSSKHRKKINWQKSLIVILLVYSALDSAITSGNSKAYIARAAEWIELNKPVESRFMTNHGHIAVIAGHCYYDCFRGNITTFLQQVRNIDANYLAIQLRQKHQERNAKIIALVQSPDWVLIKSFSNEQNDKVVVLKSRKTDD